MLDVSEFGDAGAVERKMRQQAKATGREPPRLISDAPALGTGLGLFLEAFFVLDKSRSHSMGYSHIRPADIFGYADEYDFTGDDRYELIHHVMRMDDANKKFVNGKK